MKKLAKRTDRILASTRHPKRKKLNFEEFRAMFFYLLFGNVTPVSRMISGSKLLKSGQKQLTESAAAAPTSSVFPLTPQIIDFLREKGLTIRNTEHGIAKRIMSLVKYAGTAITDSHESAPWIKILIKIIITADGPELYLLEYNDKEDQKMPPRCIKLVWDEGFESMFGAPLVDKVPRNKIPRPRIGWDDEATYVDLEDLGDFTEERQEQPPQRASIICPFKKFFPWWKILILVILLYIGIATVIKSSSGNAAADIIAFWMAIFVLLVIFSLFAASLYGLIECCIKKKRQETLNKFVAEAGGVEIVEDGNESATSDHTAQSTAQKIGNVCLSAGWYGLLAAMTFVIWATAEEFLIFKSWAPLYATAIIVLTVWRIRGKGGNLKKAFGNFWINCLFFIAITIGWFIFG